MRNRLKNVFNSTPCEVGMLVIICCMIMTSLANKSSAEWTSFSVASALIGGVVLVALLIWATVKLISGKEVKEMAPKSRLIVESLSRVLLLVWIYLVMGLVIAAIWAALIIWDGIRSYKTAFPSM